MAEPLEAVIGYRFKNPGLLKLAMSHKSYASESGSGAYNERLEFLGAQIGIGNRLDGGEPVAQVLQIICHGGNKIVAGWRAGRHLGPVLNPRLFLD